MNQSLEHIVGEELTQLNYDLVELRRTGSKGRPVFDVRIDRCDGSAVSIDDCVRASKALEARIDASGVLGTERYVLEVSSPGMDRRLTRAADWKRFAGRKVNVKSAALGGRLEGEIVEVEAGESGELITLRDAVGVEHRVALADVAEARLAVQWP